MKGRTNPARRLMSRTPKPSSSRPLRAAMSSPASRKMTERGGAFFFFFSSSSGAAPEGRLPSPRGVRVTELPRRAGRAISVSRPSGQGSLKASTAKQLLAWPHSHKYGAQHPEGSNRGQLTDIFLQTTIGFMVLLSGEIDCVRDTERAVELLVPLRLTILRLAREPP